MARLDQINLVDIFREFHPKAVEYRFSSSVHGMFSRIDYMLGHKTSLIKFKKTEMISSIFSGHNAMKLEINHKNKTGKYTKTWKPNNMLLNNEWVKVRLRKKSKDTLKQMKRKTQQPKICGTQERQY